MTFLFVVSAFEDRRRRKQLQLYVISLFGHDQNDRFRFSLNSLKDRIQFSRYHLDELRRLILPWTSGVGPTAGPDPQFSASLAESAAHVTACLQSLHATAYIVAHAIYFALGLNLSAKLKERKVDTAAVRRLILIPRIANAVDALVADPQFAYLAAVVNRSKHRSVVPTVYTFHRTDSHDAPTAWHGVAIWAFDHLGEAFPARPAEAYLSDELQRQELALEGILVSLEDELRSRLEQQRRVEGSAWRSRRFDPSNEGPDTN